MTTTALLEASHDGNADRLKDPAGYMHLTIFRLRQRVEEMGWRIVTSRGYGYKLERSDAKKHTNSS